MGIEDGTTEFKLTRPIEYRVNGEVAMAEMVVLREPCMDHVKHYLRLKQLLMRAQMGVASQADEIKKMQDSVGEVVKPIDQDAENIERKTPEIALFVAWAIQAAPTVAIEDFIETFATMACMKARKPLALIDGRQAMTQALWLTIKPDDAFQMAVWWCAFFVMPSQEGGKTTSDQPSDSAMQRTVA